MRQFFVLHLGGLGRYSFLRLDFLFVAFASNLLYVGLTVVKSLRLGSGSRLLVGRERLGWFLILASLLQGILVEAKHLVIKGLELRLFKILDLLLLSIRYRYVLQALQEVLTLLKALILHIVGILIALIKVEGAWLVGLELISFLSLLLQMVVL